ncbi:hypothetical protein EJB05_17225, partial [Eragrostis curvula]
GITIQFRALIRPASCRLRLCSIPPRRAASAPPHPHLAAPRPHRYHDSLHPLSHTSPRRARTDVTPFLPGYAVIVVDTLSNAILLINSRGPRILIILTSIVSFLATIPAIVRVIRLKSSSRSEDDTLFWWYLCFGCGGYLVWMYYYWDCDTSGLAAFPIYVSSIALALTNFILLVCATVITCGDGDQRIHLMYIVPAVLWLLSLGMWVAGVNWIGWWGLALTSLAHGFRVAGTVRYHILVCAHMSLCSKNYRDAAADINFCCWDFPIPFKVFSASISLVGAIFGFLWTINPRLDISLEFKITSYIIGGLRAWEFFLWCSRAIARVLSKIEGKVQEGNM